MHSIKVRAEKKVKIKHTIPNIRVFDLLQDLGPDCRMAFFVFFDAFGLEVEPLADAAWALVGC